MLAFAYRRAWCRICPVGAISALFSTFTPFKQIALTKLDGSSKGGVIVGIANEFEIPIRFVGIGEDMDDLQPFYAKDFVNALFLDNQIKSQDS
jgi:fused signal recognition particle receptor